MADVGVIFGFTLTELSSLSLTELMEWRERAVLRSGANQ